ncbi:hypothetical protein COO60DRAFT_127049 [Scenedesmus sp. NREL 46B-D3]|nr:hypothetical protein COO60DRAFT_127049 [Scenedesmus sp. NREL 46B-D3]
MSGAASVGCAACACSSSSDNSTSSLVLELQQQVATLLSEKQQVEADRQEMAIKQGNYKGTIAQLEGMLTFSERKVKDQLAAMEKLQAQVSSLTSELQEAQGAATQTPDRCKTAARALQAEADRAVDYARNNEARVKKLRQIVQLGARELSELLEFAEQERLTLLEKEAALQQDLGQVRQRAETAEGAAADAAAGAAELDQQLAAAQQELAESEARVQQLQEQLAAVQEQVQQLEEHGSVLAAERDAAACNLLRAETELNDVGEYSTKMFRQVRFISHMLDKHSALVGKLPDFANLARDLRSFVAANACNWEQRRDREPELSSGRTMSQTTSYMADTPAGGSRDVKGKA